MSMDYTSTVIPVILIVWFASKCVRNSLIRLFSDLIKFFFVPMLTLLIALPVGFLLIGPVATFGSTIIAQVVMSIRDFSPLLAGGIVGLTWQYLSYFWFTLGLYSSLYQ